MVNIPINFKWWLPSKIIHQITGLVPGLGCQRLGLARSNCTTALYQTGGLGLHQGAPWPGIFWIYISGFIWIASIFVSGCWSIIRDFHTFWIFLGSIGVRERDMWPCRRQLSMEHFWWFLALKCGYGPYWTVWVKMIDFTPHDGFSLDMILQLIGDFLLWMMNIAPQKTPLIFKMFLSYDFHKNYGRS